MKAKDLYQIFKTNKKEYLLIGLVIHTKEIGDWKGGPARITEITPDPEVPEIVFQVKSTIRENDEIGVFANEKIHFCDFFE